MERSGNSSESNIPSTPSCRSVGLPRQESSNLLPELSSMRMALHESHDITRHRLSQGPGPWSEPEGWFGRDPKLAFHVVSSSRREEMMTPMHWLSGSSLLPNSFSLPEDGPVLIFHLLLFIFHICWYSFPGLELNVVVMGSRISCFEANAAIPQLFAQWVACTKMWEPLFFFGMYCRACWYQDGACLWKCRLTSGSWK